MQSVLVTLTHRWSIIIANAILVFLVLQGTWMILDHFGNLSAFQEDMETSLDGLGTILVAFGVALEERETLMRFLGLYPVRHTAPERYVDEQCHYHGLCILLVGLFMEVMVFLIRMPDLETVDFDPALLAAATVLNLLGGVLLARLSWLLIRMRFAEAA